MPLTTVKALTVSSDQHWQNLQNAISDLNHLKFGNLPPRLMQWANLLAFNEFACSYVDTCLATEEGRQLLLDAENEWTMRITASTIELLSALSEQ